MQVTLRQFFPLGGFHATPWRANVFDDPYGEWPPSPFRLLRAVVARFYQLQRESGIDDSGLDRLIECLATSEIKFHLPPPARRGPTVRQYQPGIGLAWDPPGKKDQAKGAMKVSRRSLVQDNSFAVPPREAVYWFLEGSNWTEDALALLDACLARMTYFGRAEAITEIARYDGPRPAGIDINCTLEDRRAREAVPVLCVMGTITRTTLEAATDEEPLHSSTVPPGAVWRYAVRPRRPTPAAIVVRRKYRPTKLVQFALGSVVEPPLSAITTMTGWFRGRVLRNALIHLTNGECTRWQDVSRDIRSRVRDLCGKDEEGMPLQGYRHARYLMSWDGERLSRLFVHLPRDLEDWEYDAILRAADRPLGWTPAKSTDWMVNMVPLDAAVPLPGGFDGSAHPAWRSITPFVPTRFHLDSRGRVKKGESIEEQVARELEALGRPPARLGAIEHAGWMRVHAPKRTGGGQTNNARRSYWFRLGFAEPIEGPLALGHSSFFGLGIFGPA